LLAFQFQYSKVGIAAKEWRIMRTPRPNGGLMQFFLLLSLSAVAAFAQPATFSVTGNFRNGANTVSVGLRTVALEFLPAEPQPVSLSTTSFTYSSYGRLRATAIQAGGGSPAPVRAVLDLTITQAGSAQSAEIGAIVQADAQGATLTFFPTNAPFVAPFVAVNRVGTIDGVHYSFPDAAIPILAANGPATATIELPARITRGVTTISPSQVALTSVRGRTLSGQVHVTTVGCEPFSGDLILDFSGTTGGTGCGPGGYFFSAFPLSGVFNFLMPFHASGVPRADLRITVDVQPDPDTLRATPRELNFFYTRGAPEPPDQFLTVTGSSDLAFEVGFYDNTWVTITRQGVANTSAGVLRATPRMSNKPAGTHRTPVQIYTRTGVTDTVYINFFVANGPAVLRTSVEPAGAGGIAYSPALGQYHNGDPLQLTAIANPGYVFSHWSGDVASKQNPIQVTLNGALNLSAVFTGPSQCIYTFSPSRIIFLSSGGRTGARVSTMSWCETRAASTPSWIFAQFPLSFFGDGSLDVLMLANNGATRSGAIRVGNQELAVEQLSSACDRGVRFNVPPTLDAAGETLSVVSRAPNQCSYGAESTQSWLSVPASMQYFGNSQVPIRAVRNPLEQPRTASLIIAGRRVAVLQKAEQPAVVFSDVDPESAAAPYIELLGRSNIDPACTPGRFCPKQLVTRQEAAMLLVRAILRGDDFRAPAGAYFQDVPATHPLYRYIQKLVELGVTSGCRTGYFCPNDTLDRGQLAILLSRARSYSTFPALLFPGGPSNYSDVPLGLYSYPVQQMLDWGIDYGCDANRYCPGDKVTREQMAVALVRMFLTP
jgi:hypothetical protein